MAIVEVKDKADRERDTFEVFKVDDDQLNIGFFFNMAAPVQPAASGMTLLLSLHSFYTLFSIPTSFQSTTHALLTHKAIALCTLDLFSLASPTTFRLALTLPTALLRLAQILYLNFHPRTRLISTQITRHLHTTLPPPLHHTHTPKTLHTHNPLSPHHFTVLSLTLLASFLTLSAFELYRCLTNQNPLLGLADMDALRTAVGVEMAKAGVNPGGEATGMKAVLVILDGLRADWTERNPRFKEVVEGVSADLVKVPMKVQLPSMSVPNWLTFLTGSPPWMTGVMGNMAVQNTAYDSIFSLAFENNRTAGLTGSSWFADLVEGYLSLTASGTNDASFAYHQENMTNAQFADTQRAVAVEDIITGRVGKGYEFYLVHYSDVDERGHYSGVTTQYNKFNTYDQAVTDKANAIQNIFENVDNDTMVFVVSDHGHVDSGGHGGVDPHLTTTFMMAYQRNSNLSSRFNYTGVGIHSVDVAPTICATIGLPMPANSIGSIFTPLTSLFLSNPYPSLSSSYWTTQQRGLRGTFDSLLGTRFSQSAPSSTSLIDTSIDFSEAVKAAQMRNVYGVDTVLAILWAVVASACACMIVVRLTGCESFLVVVARQGVNMWKEGWGARRVRYSATATMEGDGRSEADGRGSVEETSAKVPEGGPGSGNDFLAVGVAALSVVAYHLVTIVAYLLAWRFMGKFDWDSTVMHHPKRKSTCNFLVFENVKD
ncbi:hypothetical protein HK104_000028 [Borealophlyctis nickersoniae]|nr:hypothetical protein HK104_000028 [Borealophlyctis nickersoniae]